MQVGFNPLTWYFTKGEIARVKRLSDADRAALKERLSELDPSGAGERKRMESRVAAFYSFDEEGMLNLERTYYDNATIYDQLGIYQDPRRTIGKVMAGTSIRGQSNFGNRAVLTGSVLVSDMV